MYSDGIKKMQQMALPALKKRNEFVIQKGEAAFQQTGGLDQKLAEFVKTDHNQIREDIFTEVFLPFFAKDKDSKYPQVTIDHWIGATGETIKPTDVINAQGEHVKLADGTPLTIPAVFNREAVRTMFPGRDGNNAATGQIMEEAKRYENMGENTVRSVMGRHLAAKAHAAKVPGRVLQNARVWNKILAHYGRPPLYVIPGELAAQSAVPQSQSGSPSPDGGDSTYYELP